MCAISLGMMTYVYLMLSSGILYIGAGPSCEVEPCKGLH